MEPTDIIEILDTQEGTRVDMSVEELETYAKAHINDPDWAFTPFRNKIHIDYLVDASEVYKLDDISLKTAIYILRMINVYETRGEVDEFIESGLNISIEKLAKKGYLKVMECVIKELEGEEARKKFQKKREKLEKAPIPVRLDFDIYTVFKDLTDYIFALYDNANLFYDEPELKIKEKVVISLMKEQLEESRKSNLEFGLTMCANKDDIIEAEKIIKSAEKEVIIEDRCPSGFKIIGTYHTHPNEISRPSAWDLLNACNHTADCIGGTKDNKIKCYIRKKEIDQIDCAKEFSELKSLEEDFRTISIDIERKKKLLLKERERLSTIKPRSRKTDIELRDTKKKIKEHNETMEQFNKNMIYQDHMLSRGQNKYFDEMEIK